MLKQVLSLMGNNFLLISRTEPTFIENHTEPNYANLPLILYYHKVALEYGQYMGGVDKVCDLELDLELDLDLD